MQNLEILFRGNSLARAERRLPEYVTRRMNAFLVDRVQGLCGGSHPVHGMEPPPDALHLSSNDYLGLLAVKALRRHQAGAMLETNQELLMSAVFLHGESSQQTFEKRLAHFMRAEDGVLCQSGWAANVGLIQSLAGPDVPVYLDISAHASLWEGALSAQARAIPFLHNHVEHARSQIAKNGPGVIVVDSVYSTTGSAAPLVAMTELAESTGSVLVVDESHSLGTHGPRGSGLVCELNLAHRVHFRTASLAKAFAGRAGFVTCSSEFKGYFTCESRQAIFSSGLLAHEIAWFNAALNYIATADTQRARLHAITRHARRELSALGYNVSNGTEQIIGLEAGTEPQNIVLRDALERRGVFGAVFCAPATPKNHALVRLTLNANHTDADVERLLKACAAIREEVDFTSWSSTRRLRRQDGRRLAGQPA